MGRCACFVDKDAACQLGQVLTLDRRSKRVCFGWSKTQQTQDTYNVGPQDQFSVDFILQQGI